MNTQPAVGEPAFTLTRRPTSEDANVTGTMPPSPPAYDIPPGVEIVTLPGGNRILAYPQHPTTTTPAAPHTPAAQQIPGWAKTTALLAPTVGGGVAAAGYGLSLAAPGLIAMSDALWAVVALVIAAPLAAVALLGATRSRAAEEQPTQITQNITATGLFGRANGTINH